MPSLRAKIPYSSLLILLDPSAKLLKKLTINGFKHIFWSGLALRYLLHELLNFLILFRIRGGSSSDGFCPSKDTQINHLLNHAFHELDDSLGDLKFLQKLCNSIDFKGGQFEDCLDDVHRQVHNFLSFRQCNVPRISFFTFLSVFGCIFLPILDFVCGFLASDRVEEG